MSTTTHVGPQRLSSNSPKCALCGDPSSGPWLRAPDRFHGRTAVYELVRCRRCGLVQLLDPPPPKEMPFHYDQGYHNTIENAGETEIERRWSRQRSTILNLKTGGALLDIGCSSGAFLRALKGPAWQLHGVDTSAEEARKARTSTGAEVFAGDPLEAPYQPESFDVITCFHTLEHVYEPLELLRKIFTWLRPGGILYLILPNIDSWEACIFGSYWYGLELPRHLFHFSPSSLERAIEAVHLRTVKLDTREDSFSEHSLHYILETLAGTSRVPMATLAAARSAPLAVKAVRKLFRVSIELLFGYAASAAGRGASIEGVFSKH
jgi:SAM-dependent methyltransferase